MDVVVALPSRTYVGVLLPREATQVERQETADAEGLRRKWRIDGNCGAFEPRRDKAESDRAGNKQCDSSHWRCQQHPAGQIPGLALAAGWGRADARKGFGHRLTVTAHVTRS